MFKEKGIDRLGVHKEVEAEPQQTEASKPLEKIPPHSPQDCSVTIMSGATTQELHLAHQTVRDVRRLLKDSFNIGSTAVAIVNGREVTEDQLLNPKDRLEFIKKAGHKGSMDRMRKIQSF